LKPQLYKLNPPSLVSKFLVFPQSAQADFVFVAANSIRPILDIQPKPEKQNHLGSQLLAGLVVRGKPKKSSPGQMAFPWAQWEIPDSDVQQVAEKFVFANCYNPQVAGVMMQQCPQE